MSTSTTELMTESMTDGMLLTNARPEYFQGIQDLCRKVYPFSKPWSVAQLEAHQSYFPEGQLVVVETSTNRVVGLAFSLIISWDDYSPQDNWADFTSGGYFHNHDPKKGTTLYGAEVMVDPEYRGRGLGKMLYEGRQRIAEEYGLKRIRAGARLRGYSKFQDKFSPEEYAREVVLQKIFDPTLSFQLGRGFVVLDVAKNYLFNDPESLGYAAVIEWLNPITATERDLKRQKDSMEFFMSAQKFVIEYLPRELRHLVRHMTILLGRTIREYEGDAFFDRIEHYRQALKRTRTVKDEKLLANMYRRLAAEKPHDQFKLAHGFALLMELINVCESAYRTWRQQQRTDYRGRALKTELNFVLTAHPTEARSKEVVIILRRLTELLVQGLQGGFVFRDSEIKSRLRLLWMFPLVKTRAPTVANEAEYIFSQVLSPEILDFILRPKESYDLKLRTWVGGDKDGHPGVNAEVMLRCLEKSRHHLLQTVRQKLELIKRDLTLLRDTGTHRGEPHIQRIQRLLRMLTPLQEIRSSDGKRVQEFIKYFRILQRSKDRFLAKHHEMMLLGRLFEIFPGLVLPIELREDAGAIAAALKNPHAVIAQMVASLRKMANGLPVTAYARALVISHCESDQDLRNAESLLATYLGGVLMPVVPLFETRQALLSSKTILNAWLQEPKRLRVVQQLWGNRVEVMVGYSDSAKQVGALPSRYLIRNAMFEMEKTLKKFKVTPVFFHGSGGSVARGGGSLKEQIQWWPGSAVYLPKLTVQGEMIQRNFATKEILNSQCVHLSNEARLRRAKRVRIPASPALEKFTAAVEQHYSSLVADTEFLETCLEATPYNYLRLLKIGSRPSKRPSGPVSVESLRAIPWVLCWTQTRILLPGWWGVGTAWNDLTEAERHELAGLYKTDPFFSSFVKVLGFTLAKVELGIWHQYLKHRRPKRADAVFEKFQSEYKKCQAFMVSVTGQKHLIEHRPWLEESIRLRAPYIHILNLLQIQAMASHDEKLLKETLVGIACGMLTTG